MIYVLFIIAALGVIAFLVHDLKQTKGPWDIDDENSP